MNFQQAFFLSFLFISPFLILDAYGFREQAEELAELMVIFIAGFALGAWLL